MKKKVLFTGYAPVHFLCFRPIYNRLKQDPGISVFLSGGFRSKEAGRVTYDPKGFFDFPGVDPEDVLTIDRMRREDFDVLVCSHLSDSLFPNSVERTVQIFHGVSFKNYSVREKALVFDILCLPGSYHSRMYRKRGLLSSPSSEVLITGFAKTDPLVDGSLDRMDVIARHGLDPDLPVLLYAPTGDKYNSLELYGEDLIGHLTEDNRWNLLIKPHDHPKNRIDWFERLDGLTSRTTRLVRDLDVVPYLHAADVLISDASSVVTEFTLLDRPIVLLDVPKLLRRVVKRGGALDLDSYAHRIAPVVADPENVSNVIGAQLQDDSEYSQARREMAKAVFHMPGTAADRVAGVVRYAAGLAAIPAGTERISGRAKSIQAA